MKNRALSIILFALFFCIPNCRLYENSHITAVEHGLRHNILIAGDKHQHMTLAERMHDYKAPAVQDFVS
jgi:hypothetical protein